LASGNISSILAVLRGACLKGIGRQTGLSGTLLTAVVASIATLVAAVVTSIAALVAAVVASIAALVTALIAAFVPAEPVLPPG